MALPLTRARTYATTTPVNPADLNDLQDAIIARKHGPGWRWRAPLGRAGAEVNITWTNGYANANAGSAVIDLVPIDAVEGETITGIAARVKGTGAGGNVVVTLYRGVDDSAPTSLESLSFVTPTASWVTTTKNMTTNYTVVAGDQIYWGVTLATLNQRIRAVGLRTQKI